MVAFSVLIVGLQPELLYIYLPFIIVVGVAVAFGLKTLVGELWVSVKSFFNFASSFELPWRERQAEIGSFIGV